MMRLSHGRIYSPRGFKVAINGAFDSPAILVKICRRATELDPLRLGDARLENAHRDFRQMQVAIVLAARSMFWQGLVRQDIQAKRGNIGQGTSRGYSVGVFI